MARTLINPLSTVEWNANYGCQIDNKGKIVIELNGSMSGTNMTADQISAAIPAAPPEAIVGGYSSLLGVTGIRFSSDDSGFVEISATYEGTTFANNGGPGGDTENTRYELRGQAMERDITTHPKYADYADTDKQLLALLLSGDVRANPAYTGTGSGLTTWEFIMDDKDKIVEADFSNTGGGLTAKEMARRIARGVRTYYGPTITATKSYTQRNPLSASDIDKLGKIEASIEGITVSNDRKWLVSGFTQSNATSNSYDISEEYLLSDDGGPDELIYPDA